MPRSKTPAWFHQAVFYQVYPQSFYDSNGDGIGDLPGLTAKLPYIRSLGCNAVWINPFFVSPFQDAGYDVADYERVAPRYGSNADARRLFLAAKRLGLRICLDLVPGHSSIEHPWFEQSALPKKNAYSDRYIWTDSAWKGPEEAGLEGVRGYSDRDGAYVTNFFYSQPALNYGFAEPDPGKRWQLSPQHPTARATGEAMLKVMRFWLKMGADGFRVDMAGQLVKLDPGQRANIRLWQGLSARLKREFPDAALISEWGVPRRALHAGFDADFMLHFPSQAYNSLCRHGRNSYFDPRSDRSAADFLKEYLGHRRAARGLGHIAVPSGNHDMDRMGHGRDAAQKAAYLAFICTLPGVPFIYYGDEIGMDKLDGLDSKEGGYNRTGSRTPMQWAPGPKKGFSRAAPAKFYLPVDRRQGAPTVAQQDQDPGSLLNLVRRLLALRSRQPALQARGGFKVLWDGREGKPLVYVRGEGPRRVLVVIQPKRKASSIRLPRAFSGTPTALEARRCSLHAGGKAWTVRTGGTGFGLFALSNASGPRPGPAPSARQR